MAVVEGIRPGKTRDPLLATCARNIWLITAIFNIQLQAIHVPCKANDIADLSTWLITNNPEEKLAQLLPNFTGGLILVGKSFIDMADIYCFGTGLPILRSKHVFQYHHLKQNCKLTL